MADISTAQKSCRVDLTPMVDLGFLLITFFVFTTSLNQPVVLKLFLPHDTDKDSSLSPAGKTLSMIIAENKLAFYTGNNIHNPEFVNDNVDDVRARIIQHLAIVKEKFGDSKEAIILIKPTPQSQYRQLVNCLDEMTINNVKKYVLTEATNEEQNMLLKKRE